MTTDLRPSVFSRYVVMWVKCLKSFVLVNFGNVAKECGDDAEAIKIDMISGFRYLHFFWVDSPWLLRYGDFGAMKCLLGQW